MNSIILTPTFGIVVIGAMIKKLNSLFPIRTLLTDGDTTLKGHLTGEGLCMYTHTCTYTHCYIIYVIMWGSLHLPTYKPTEVQLRDVIGWCVCGSVCNIMTYYIAVCMCMCVYMCVCGWDRMSQLCLGAEPQ